MKKLVLGLMFLGASAMGADLSILSGKYKCTGQRAPAGAPATEMVLQLDTARHFVWVQGQAIGTISGFATIIDTVDLNKMARIELFNPANVFAIEAVFTRLDAAQVRLKFSERYGVLACDKI